MSSKINLGVPEFILKMGNPTERYVYEFGDFRLDAGHLMLYQKDKELSLAPKAVETLIALVERRGEIMSKDELLETVWPDAIVEESNLFVYLSVLRKTLGTQENGDPWVETRRRRGYRFTGEVRLVPAQNGENGVPYTRPSTLKLIPPASNLPAAITDNSPSEPRPGRWTNLRTFYTAAVLAIGVAAVAFGYQYFVDRKIDSIAVMPFVNETQDPELEYVADGITESFITNLSKTPNLKVQAKSAVARYKDREADPKMVGTDLGVEAVVSGRLMKRGEDIELRIELFDAQTGARVWEATDTQRIQDLIVLGRKIQRELVTRLGFVQLDSTEQDVTDNHPTNTEAYRLYQKGRAYSLKLTQEEIGQGIDYLYQAIEKDAGYALAYAGIARAHLFLGIAGEARPSEFIKARETAKKAIELDESLAEGYSALAGVAFFYERNFAEAERLYKRALELSPRSATAHQQYADFLNKTGRREEGTAEIARAMDLDPHSVFINTFYAVSLPDKDALEQILYAKDLGPDNYIVHLFAGEIYRRSGMFDEAVAELRRAKELSPQTWSDVALVGALVHAGETDEARMMADAMLRDSQTRYIPPAHLGLVYLQLGENDKAFKYLEEGYNARDPKMVFLNEPIWNDYRDDPRFQDLLRRVGFTL